MDLAIGKRLAIGNGILTVENEACAWARARIGEATRVRASRPALALKCIALRRRLLGQAR